MRTTLGPNGEEMVLLSREEYEDLLDARGHAAAMRAVASGTLETLSEADAHAYLQARTPLAFWRRQRGMTQSALAQQVGVSQAYVAQIEAGTRVGTPVALRDIARSLQVRMEDLVA